MPSITIKSEATSPVYVRAGIVFCLISALLAGCAGPRSAPAPERFDLGPATPTAAAAAPAPTTVPVWLAGVQAPSSLDGMQMLYRLDYSNHLQSRAYAQARWSMPVPELLEQRLRQHLSRTRAVLNLADGVQSRAPGVILRVELEDFGQAFSTPDQARAQVRVRATLSAWRGGVEQLLAQRSFQAAQPCASADAPGGVRALATATDQVLAELERWVDATAAP